MCGMTTISAVLVLDWVKCRKSFSNLATIDYVLQTCMGDCGRYPSTLTNLPPPYSIPIPVLSGNHSPKGVGVSYVYSSDADPRKPRHVPLVVGPSASWLKSGGYVLFDDHSIVWCSAVEIRAMMTNLGGHSGHPSKSKSQQESAGEGTGPKNGG